MILGAVGTLYLWRVRRVAWDEQARALKEPATRYLIAATASFTLGIATVFVNGLHIWGTAFSPLQDGFAALAAAAMIRFAYHYPAPPSRKEVEFQLAQSISLLITVTALGYSAYYAYRSLVLHDFLFRVHDAYLALMPLAFAGAMAAALRRLYCLHPAGAASAPWWRHLGRALRHPTGEGRVLRDFALSLTLAAAQGVASGLAVLGLIPWPIDLYLFGLTSMLMIVFIISATLENVAAQTSVQAKVIGLTLSVVMAIVGVVGILEIHRTARHQAQLLDRDVTLVLQALRTREEQALPPAPSVAYVVAWPATPPAVGAAPIVYHTRSPTFEIAHLRAEGPDPQAHLPTPRHVNPAIHYSADWHAARTVLRYGEHPLGSAYRYMGYQVVEAWDPDHRYEIGFLIAEIERPLRRTAGTMSLVVLGSTLLILIALPYFLRLHVARPLDHLLAGVRRIERGTLNVAIPVTHPDEIGSLTRAFNHMAHTISREITKRRQAEEQITTLNANLASQVAAQMRELADLYEQSKAANQRMAVFEERQRIARDLHDSAAQELYGLVTLTGAAQLQLEQGDLTSAAHTLTRIGETGRQAIREMRLFIHHLNPPRLEEEGLVGALHQRLATVEGRADVETRILADNTIAPPLPVQRALYQIAQEALNNCLRHAGADHITVYLGREHDDVILEVIDDGQGFDTIGLDHPAGGMEAGAGYGMGLKNMRQRAASIEAALTITSSPGYGTRVRVVVHAAEAAGPQGRNHAD